MESLDGVSEGSDFFAVFLENYHFEKILFDFTC